MSKLTTIIVFLISSNLWAQNNIDSLKSNYSFGKGGNLKMLYDRRQRPQALKYQDSLFIVFNGNASNLREKPKTYPMIASFNIKTKKYGSEFIIDTILSSDHHHCPIFWIGNTNKFNVIYGAHNSSGYHLTSKNVKSIGNSYLDWVKKPFLNTNVSYPSLLKSLFGDVVYFREYGHTGHWKYALWSEESGYWKLIEKPITNLDKEGMFEWSSYHSVILGENKRFLHVAFVSYDDNKENNPGRYFNERYNMILTNDFKYNLYYLKIDLSTNEAYNFYGKQLKLPIDLYKANTECLIWNTQGRGSGIPPEIIIDKNGNAAFLHVITEETIDNLSYYFIKFHDGEWIKSKIRSSNHQWNNGGIIIKKNKYYSYLIVGDSVTRTKYDDGFNLLKKNLKNWTKINEFNGNYLDKHGGGDIEEWVSVNGIDWKFSKKISPHSKDKNWKYNNIQFVNDSDGNQLENYILYYGWETNKPKNTSVFFHIED